MKTLVLEYANTLAATGMVDPDDILVGGLDAELEWSSEHPARDELAKLFDGLSINSLIYARPAEPYASIVEHLCGVYDDSINPSDCETRTFLHDLPIVREFDGEQMISRLRQRKSVIVPGHGIVTWGTVSPEQACVFLTSVLFACFVKYFTDYLQRTRAGKITEAEKRTFDVIWGHVDDYPTEAPQLMQGPFETQKEIHEAICESGRAVVDCRLVDSSFGNVSYLNNGVICISQTGAWLDKLEGLIDDCPLDGSNCAGITASSELTAHRETALGADIKAILHGHPRFAVVISIDCERADCPASDACHIRCPDERFAGDIPIVPGEVGTGPTGLCNTLPPAIKGRRGVIVYGHGLFTIGQDDFNDAFASLLDVERSCKEEYLRRVRG